MTREIENALASLTPATIFAQSLPTGAMVDRVVVADKAAEDKAAEDLARMVGLEDRQDMPDSAHMTLELEVVAVEAQRRDSHAR